MKYQNIYEKTFAYALEELNISFDYLPQSGKTPIKRFDFLVRSADRFFAVEVKGRLLHTAANLTDSSYQNWITCKDADSLMFIDENCYPSYICFVYRLENPFYELEEEPSYLCDNERFIFRLIRIKDYVALAGRRSSKWKTLNIPASSFRELSFTLDGLLGEL